ncbi:hypothetical protein ACSX1A_06595 [Pontibacter sp. MBLB2868]|uniref:hypothetical protein n=1 Tax=Pontibacter sp. MBLB2868 TaxID=3451555 RepID=UPI003F754407
MVNKALFVFLLLAVLAVGCKENYVEPDKEALGLAYYPLEIGDYRIYNVLDIRYKFNVGDTTRFQIKERVDTTFYDQSDKLTYKIIRSVRPNEGSEWVDDSVMVITKTESMLLLTKNNTKYVKLVFPVKEGAVWVGDAYNDHVAPGWIGNKINGKEVYTYESVGQPFEVSGEVYPETTEVIHGDFKNDGVVYNDRKEVYAKGVGLIYSLYKRIDYCSTQGCNFAEGYKLQGHERYESLISYGSL